MSLLAWQRVTFLVRVVTQALAMMVTDCKWQGLQMAVFKMQDCAQHDSYVHTGCFTVALLQCTCRFCSSHEVITVTASQHCNQVATTGAFQHQDFGEGIVAWKT